MFELSFFPVKCTAGFVQLLTVKCTHSYMNDLSIRSNSPLIRLWWWRSCQNVVIYCWSWWKSIWRLNLWIASDTCLTITLTRSSSHICMTRRARWPPVSPKSAADSTAWSKRKNSEHSDRENRLARFISISPLHTLSRSGEERNERARVWPWFKHLHISTHNLDEPLRYGFYFVSKGLKTLKHSCNVYESKSEFLM